MYAYACICRRPSLAEPAAQTAETPEESTWKLPEASASTLASTRAQRNAPRVCTRVHVYAYVCVCICMCIHMHVYAYACACICMCMHMHVYAYACICLRHRRQGRCLARSRLVGERRGQTTAPRCARDRAPRATGARWPAHVRMHVCACTHVRMHTCMACMHRIALSRTASRGRWG